MDVFLKQRFSKRWHLSFSSFYLADSSFLEIEGDPNGGRNSLLQVHFPGQRRERLVDSVWKGEGNLLVFLFFFFFKWKDASRFGSAEAFLCGVPPNPLEVAPWVRRFIYSQSHVSCVPFPLYPGPPDDGAEQEEQRCWQRTQKRAEGRRVSTGAAVWKENTVSLAPL